MRAVFISDLAAEDAGVADEKWFKLENNEKGLTVFYLILYRIIISPS